MPGELWECQQQKFTDFLSRAWPSIQLSNQTGSWLLRSKLPIQRGENLIGPGECPGLTLTQMGDRIMGQRGGLWALAYP